jgi:hypothetical protein
MSLDMIRDAMVSDIVDLVGGDRRFARQIVDTLLLNHVLEVSSGSYSEKPDHVDNTSAWVRRDIGEAVEKVVHVTTCVDETDPGHVRVFAKLYALKDRWTT